MCLDKVEDETHFLTECRLYGSLGRHWGGIYDLAPQLSALTNAQKFEFIMIQEDPEILNRVLRMVYDLTLFRKFMCENFYQQK